MTLICFAFLVPCGRLEAVWMYQGDSILKGKLSEIGSQFQEMLVSLEQAQVEYDIGCEDIIARQGSFSPVIRSIPDYQPSYSFGCTGSMSDIDRNTANESNLAVM